MSDLKALQDYISHYEINLGKTSMDNHG